MTSQQVTGGESCFT